MTKLFVQRTMAGWLTAVSLTLTVAPATAEVEPAYSVKALLSPCVEGADDARWGRPLLAVCEQYIRGFSDVVSYLEINGDMQGICLPESPDHVGEIRRAFVKWATHHTEHQDWPAVRGLLQAARMHFPC